jgi:serine/threonine protein kinase/Tfp pilus assembly protein PilF
MNQDSQHAFRLRNTEILDDEPSDTIAVAMDRLAAGTRVAHYEIVRPLGRGGMGEVYLARDHELDRLVAVKLLAERRVENLDRFLIEARATARCQHENIIVIHQVGEHHGRPYMVLEYLEGETLGAWLADRRRLAVAGDRGVEPEDPAPPASEQLRVAIAIMRPVVRALVCAHQHGIIHRDLKPANIMFTREGGLKVLDFGIAKLRGASALSDGVELRAISQPMEMLVQSTVAGTAPYMAPEQLVGGRIDHRADLWAVGVMLWELITGVHPLTALTSNELLLIAELDRSMPALGDAGGPLGQVIARCLRKRVDERMGSARELLAELDAVDARLAQEHAQVAGERAAVEWPVQASGLKQRSSRRWLRRALGVAALGLAGAAAAAMWLRPSDALSPAPPALAAAAPTRVEVVLADFVDRTGEPGVASALASALVTGVEQSRYVHLMPADKRRTTLGLMRQPLTVAIDRPLGLEICQRAGASALLVPSIARIGSRYVIAVEVIAAATGASVAVESAETTSRDHLIDALGTLSVALRRRLGESQEALAHDVRALDKVTTADLDALRLYTLGVRRMDDMANEDAADLLQQALARDPEFAMAHAKLGIIYYYMFKQRARGRWHWRQALAHPDRLSSREALYVEGSRQWEGSPDKMLSVWARYAALYPDESVGFGNLGYVYWWYQDRFRDAADAFQKAIDRRSDSFRAYHDLGAVLLGAGRYDQAIAVFERADAANPHSGRMGRAEAYLAAGRHADALVALQAVGMPSGQGNSVEHELTRLAVFTDLGSWRAADASAGLAVELARTSGGDDDLACALFARAALLEASGGGRALRPVLAELTVQLRGELSVDDDQQLMSRPVGQLALIGAVYARNGMVSDARQLRAALGPQLAAHDVLIWRAYVALLDGELALALGDHAAAILTLRRGLGHVDLFQLHGALLRALRAGGLTDEADSELRWLVAHRGQALVEWGNTVFGRELNLLDWARARDRVAARETPKP